MAKSYRDEEGEDNRARRRDWKRRPKMKVHGQKSVQFAKLRYEREWERNAIRQT